MFNSSLPSVRTYATQRPSDDTASGCPPANVPTASMSSAVNTGAACANAIAAQDSVSVVANNAIRRCIRILITSGGRRTLPKPTRPELYTNRDAGGRALFVPGPRVRGVFERPHLGRRQSSRSAAADRADHDRPAQGRSARIVRLEARADAVARRLRTRGDALRGRGQPGAAHLAVAREHPHRPATGASRRSHERRISAVAGRPDTRRSVEGCRLHPRRVHWRLSVAPTVGPVAR